MERVVGIEPTFPAWKAGVLPIYDTRIFGAKDGTRTHDNQCHKLALYQLNYVHHMVHHQGIEPGTP